MLSSLKKLKKNITCKKKKRAIKECLENYKELESIYAKRWG